MEPEKRIGPGNPRSKIRFDNFQKFLRDYLANHDN